MLISNFLRPGHPTKFDTIYVHQLRAKGYPFLNQLFNSKILRFFFAKKIFRNFLRILEKFIPTHKEVYNIIKNNKIDLIICSPTISHHSQDIEFLKVADKLNIDDIVSIASWDNITTKGTFSKIPKKFLFGMKK